MFVFGERSVSAIKSRICLSLALCCLQLWLCAKSVAAKNYSSDATVKIKVGGLTRHARVHAPISDEEVSRPLILAFHGFLDSAGVLSFDTRLKAESDKRGFIVVFPEGYKRSWNAGDCCGLASKKRVDDVEFIRQLLDDLGQRYKIEAGKIYAIGLSNGGMFSLRLAQDAGDKFAAVASVEGSLRNVKIKPVAPVSVLMINGTEDHVIPYAGGTGKWFGFKLHSESTQTALEYWAAANNCQTPPTVEETDFGTRINYKSNDTEPGVGAEVCCYEVLGGKHLWPGGRFAKLVSKKSSRFDATEAACDFFFSHSKRISAAP